MALEGIKCHFSAVYGIPVNFFDIFHLEGFERTHVHNIQMYSCSVQLIDCYLPHLFRYSAMSTVEK